MTFYPLAIPTVHTYIKSDKAAEWALDGARVRGGSRCANAAWHDICSLVRGRALTFIDRSLGFLYGLRVALVVVSLVYLGAVMILWPDIDKPPVEADASAQPAPDKDRNAPPELLMKARTRPMMAYGADRLKIFVPKDMIDKNLKATECRETRPKKPRNKKRSTSFRPRNRLRQRSRSTRVNL